MDVSNKICKTKHTFRINQERISMNQKESEKQFNYKMNKAYEQVFHRRRNKNEQ